MNLEPISLELNVENPLFYLSLRRLGRWTGRDKLFVYIKRCASKTHIFLHQCRGAAGLIFFWITDQRLKITFNIEIVKICPWKKLWRFWLPEFNQNIVRVSLIKLAVHGHPFHFFGPLFFVVAPFWASERRFVVVVVPLRIPLWYPSGIVQKLFIVMTCNRGSLQIITSLCGFYSHLFNSVDKSW